VSTFDEDQTSFGAPKIMQLFHHQMFLLHSISTQFTNLREWALQ